MTKFNMELDSKLCEIEMSVERARTISQDLIENYFDKYSPEKDGSRITCDFHRNGIYGEIVDDYLYRIEVALKSVREFMK